MQNGSRTQNRQRDTISLLLILILIGLMSGIHWLLAPPTSFLLMFPLIIAGIWSCQPLAEAIIRHLNQSD